MASGLLDELGTCSSSRWWLARPSGAGAPERVESCSLKLLDSVTFESGVVHLTYAKA